MTKAVKALLEKTPLYRPLRNCASRRRLEAERAEWARKGRPVPPPHLVKQRVLKEYSRKYRLKILVETGTYMGDMIEAMRSHFDRIYSIELSRELYEKAAARFTGAKNITLMHGDSGSRIESVLDEIGQPALFWLDGHYSGGVTARGERDTPVREELQRILESEEAGHVIVIDDARCFGTDPAYPGLEELRGLVKAMRPNAEITVQDDSIRITPGAEATRLRR